MSIRDMTPRVAFETIGCRLNQYETESMAAQLSLKGFKRVAFEEEADLYIINTCTVTGRADASCRRAISVAARRDGKARVVVVGCLVSATPEEVARLNGVDLIINNRQKDDIVQLLSREWPELFSDQREKSPAPLLSEFYQHNRAWVKIGDGCNQNCSYCIVPLVRGRLVNRPPREIIGEIDSLVRSGYREVVLTGVHIGDYYYDNISSLTALLETILRETAVSRIRLSSIEPQEITSELIEFIANNSPRVCRHLHLPLQSGSNRILRLMHRPYTSEKYRDTAKVIKDSIEYVTIGADVIVGFPSESEDDFAQTVALAESGFLDYLHVFSYSDRKGTEASQLAGKLKPFIIKERNETLRKISKASYMKALKRQSGNILGAIAERKSKKGENCWGITDNYLKISMPPSEGDEKEIVPLKVDAIGDGFLVGSQISN